MPRNKNSRQKRTMPSILCTALFFCALLSAGTPAAPLTVCLDPDPPPWSLWVRDQQGNKTLELDGSSVALLTKVFSRLKMEVAFIGDMPWVRCLKSVEAGKVDFAMDAYYDSERAKKFTYSIHYSTLTPQVFFVAQNPINVHAMADLKKYRGCGMIGASYEHYGLAPGDLDLGVTSYGGMIAKLKARRCDYFVEELEIISGYSLLGTNYIGDSQLMHEPVSDATRPSKHLIAGKGNAAAQLIPEIDRELAALIASGEAARLWHKFGGADPYTP